MKLKFYILFFSYILSTAVFTNLYAQDEICNGIFLNPRCTTNGFYTYSNEWATGSPQAAPSCGNYLGGDLWFKTIVPNSGKLDIITQQGVVWDGAMAVYAASSCSGALTQLACDDDSGPDFMPQVSLTGLNRGDSIFIRFWEFGNDDLKGSFQIAVYDPNPAYCMVGNATQNFPGNCIQMTTDNPGSELSAVWSTAKLNLAASFDYTFQVYLGAKDGDGADGMAFVLHNNPAGTAAIGIAGADLGAGGINNSLIVEFDTYNNGGPMDISADHTALSINGNLNSPVTTPLRANFLSSNIEDGAWHNVRIVWNPGTRVFSVYFDNVFRFSYTNDIINNLFGGNPMVYWGFTGCTGFYNNNQAICPGTLPLPVEWNNFEAYVKAQQVWLEWSTYSESNTSEFIVERSSDGTQFTAIGKVDASGNSSSLLGYRFIDKDPLTGLSYYRLKQIDLDDSYSYSNVVSVEFDLSGLKFEIYPNPLEGQEELNVEFNFGATDTEVEFSLLNNLGQIVYTTPLLKGKNSLTLPIELPAGIYHAILKTESGTEIKKLVIQDR